MATWARERETLNRMAESLPSVGLPYAEYVEDTDFVIAEGDGV